MLLGTWFIFLILYDVSNHFWGLARNVGESRTFQRQASIFKAAVRVLTPGH